MTRAPVPTVGSPPTPGQAASLGRLLIYGLVAALVLSLLPALSGFPLSPAGAQGDLSLQAQDSSLTIDPEVLPSGSSQGAEMTLTRESPWPASTGVLLDDEDGITLLDAGQMGPTTVVGNELTFSIPENLPDGVYQIRAADFDPATGLYLRDLGSVRFAVGAASSFVIRGQVTDTSDGGVTGICVDASWERGDQWRFVQTETSTDGTYELRILEPGAPASLDVSVVFFGDCDEDRFSADDRFLIEDSLARDLTLAAGEPLVLDRTATKAAFVDVTVLDPGGAELPCSRVFRRFPGEQTVQVRGCEDAAGVEYTDVYVGNTRNPEEAEVLDLREGETVSRTVTVAPWGFVTGLVSDASTGATPDACVGVYERVDGVRTFSSLRLFPEAQGAFELRVAPGDPTIEFAACEFTDFTDMTRFEEPFPYRAQFFDGASTLADAQPVPVSSGATVPGIDAALVADDGFVDVPGDHPFVTEIGWLVGEGITTGFADGTFRPTVAVTRQAAAAFLYRLAGEPPVTSEAGFADVPSGHPFHDEIAWLVAEGITTGFPDDTFRPTQPVTRQAAAAFLYRFDGEPAVGGAAGFADVPSGHPFHDEIAWMVARGITTGFPDDTFRPANAVTRQAVAAFLYRYETQ